MNKKHMVGRTLAIKLSEHSISPIIAKVDTGAYLNSIWASGIYERDGILHFTLFDKQSSYYTGQELSTGDYYITEVENSFGNSEKRFVIKLSLGLFNYDVDEVLIRFSLCNRSMKKYPILIGRNYLRGRFTVDVMMSADNCIVDEEEGKSKINEEENRG